MTNNRDARPARYFWTFTGRRIDTLAPDPCEIEIDDIAHSLAQQCRFLGHTDGFYSVAQHSVLVSGFVPDRDALWGLLHDAAEAYVCDLPARPSSAAGACGRTAGWRTACSAR